MNFNCIRNKNLYYIVTKITFGSGAVTFLEKTLER